MEMFTTRARSARRRFANHCFNWFLIALLSDYFNEDQLVDLVGYSGGKTLEEGESLGMFLPALKLLTVTGHLHLQTGEAIINFWICILLFWLPQLSPSSKGPPPPYNHQDPSWYAHEYTE